jgi:molecular chaperone GrpE
VSDQPQTPPTEAEQPPRPEEDVADAVQAAQDSGLGDGPADVAAGEVEADLAALRERAGQAEEYLALAQRTQADFENYRKRMTREVGAAEARGMGRLAKELLPALDNLDRALAAAESAPADGGEHHLADGIRLVQAELAAALHRTGIEGYDPKGERFDPVHHEAIAQHAVEGTEPGTIVEVLQAGYRLNESILRPARVIVAG